MNFAEILDCWKVEVSLGKMGNVDITMFKTVLLVYRLDSGGVRSYAFRYVQSDKDQFEEGII